MNLTTVRAELVEQLATIGGTPTLTVTVRPPTVLQPPHAYIDNIARVEPSQTFDGLVLVEFEVLVLVALADEDSAWDLLSNYCGTGSGSINYALNTNDTLDGTVQFTDGAKFENVGALTDYGAAQYRGCLARITVHTL